MHPIEQIASTIRVQSIGTKLWREQDHDDGENSFPQDVEVRGVCGACMWVADHGWPAGAELFQLHSQLQLPEQLSVQQSLQPEPLQSAADSAVYARKLDDHWIIEGGGGVTPAGGNTQNYANVGWNILLGTGYKFNDRLSLLAEWNFNRMGVPHSLAYASAQTPDGNEHIWTTI